MRNINIDQEASFFWQPPNPEDIVFLKELMKKRAHHRLPYEKKLVFRKYTYEGQNNFHELSKHSIDALLSALSNTFFYEGDYQTTPAGNRG